MIAGDINPPNSAVTGQPWAKVNLVDVLVRTIPIFTRAMTRRAFAADKPDELIRPSVGDVWTLDFRNAERLVAIGREAVGEELAERLRCEE